MSKNGGEKGIGNGASNGTTTSNGAASVAASAVLGGGGVMNEFVKQAIREKAERELAGLQQRLDAFGGVERSRDSLHRVATDVTAAAAGYTSMATTDTAVVSKLKKLKKLVEDAHALATELGDSLGVDRERESLELQRREILKALDAAGIDPTTVGGSVGSA
ncbi:MAG: hypothetical protein JNK05_24225 [Myxococcales bacterium]|nr:hypothetical protein [Myxococcales bacterium]